MLNNEPDRQPCLVCGQLVGGAVCRDCGADQEKVSSILQAAEEPAVPTFWQALWRRYRPLSPTAETIWADLSPDFRESTLRDYRTLQYRGRLRTTLIMSALVAVLLAFGFWVGTCMAEWLGLAEGRQGMWLYGVGGMFALYLLGFLIGPYVEGRLLRGRAETATREALEAMPMIGSAVMWRFLGPWYLSADFLMPLTLATVLLAGWFLL